MSTYVSQQLLNWLHGVLQPHYQNPQRVFNDVADCLEANSSLRVKTDIYTSTEGRSELLLLLYGTIQTKFRNSPFNVPLEVWLPVSYPVQPPIIFVPPTIGMEIRPGNHIDNNARCYHPYFASWTGDVRKFSLNGSIVILQQAFALQPPLISVNDKNVPLQTREQLFSSTHPIPPDRLHYAKSSKDPPQIPLKINLNRKTRSQEAQTAEEVVVERPPPRPAKTFTDNSPVGSVSTADGQLWQNRRPTSATHQAKARAPASTPQITSSLTAPSTDRGDLRKNLITAVVHRLAVLDEQEQLSRSTIGSGLRDHISQCSLYCTKLRALMSRTEDLQHSVRSSIDVLTDTLRRTIGTVDEGHNNAINIDEAVVAQNVLYNQLYTLVAQEIALDDTIYALGRALEHDKIDIDTFLKSTRSLARDQFAKRALTAKIARLLTLQL